MGLRRQLALARERGSAGEQDETLPGLGSVAVPVAGAGGAVYRAVLGAEVARTDVRLLVPVLCPSATPSFVRWNSGCC